MDTLFSNVTVVTMDEDLRVLFSGFVGVTDGKISYISRKAPEEQPQKIINGEINRDGRLEADVPEEIKAMIETVFISYSYLLGPVEE